MSSVVIFFAQFSHLAVGILLEERLQPGRPGKLVSWWNNGKDSSESHVEDFELQTRF